MKKSVGSIVAAAVAASALLVALPVGATNGATSKAEFAMGFRLEFKSATSAEGVWSAGGSINDSGTLKSTFKIGVKDGQPQEHGSATFYGKRGTFRDEFGGSLGPAGGAYQVCDCTFAITDGTGAYKNLKATGRFLGVANLLGRTLMGSAQGVVVGGH